MDTVNQRVSSSASVFEASTKNPRPAIASALDDIEALLATYNKTADVLDRMAVLTEIEALRRFVLVRTDLINCLRQPGQRDVRPMGRQICEALQSMIGDVPSLVKECSLQGARNVERDTRRAIASLNFLGSLDPSFL
jgi:hypothetical protein